MLKQYQQVILNRDSLKDNFFGKPYTLQRGQQGMVMEIYKKPGTPTGYDVEFFDEHGDSVALVILHESDLLPLKEVNAPSTQKVA
jgi:hypothetical protein